MSLLSNSSATIILSPNSISLGFLASGPPFLFEEPIFLLPLKGFLILDLLLKVVGLLVYYSYYCSAASVTWISYSYRSFMRSA